MSLYMLIMCFNTICVKKLNVLDKYVYKYHFIVVTSDVRVTAG